MNNQSIFDIKFRISLSILIVSFPVMLSAQAISVDEFIIYDFHRRNQILGLENSNYSFAIKPILFSDPTDFSSFYEPEKKYPNSIVSPFYFNNDKGVITLTPVHLGVKFNTHHPVGYNDGAMIPAKGIQSMIRLGFYAKYGALTIQVQPEFVYAVNKISEGYSYQYNNNIDLPRLFNYGQRIRKVYWGQTSLRLNLANLSFGFSTENLWWGPGIHNSLLMSNTAPGFPHLTFNSRKPIQTKYGSIEFQLIAGRLTDSGFGDNRFLDGDWRYLNALVLSYQPKWVKGLYIGTIRSYSQYGKDLDGLIDYLPSVFSYGKNYSLENPSKNTNRSHMESYFVRWVWEESNAEIYLEYGRKENVVNLQNEPYGPIFNNAYILGFRKLIPLNKSINSYIDLNVELTQLELNQAVLNNTYSWYEHPIVSQGYTYLGQSLGAGIGPGSNLQTFDISWVKSFKKIGLKLERLLHNNDYFFRTVKDIRANWVDISATTYIQWDYQRFLFGFQMKFVKSLNYHWTYYPKLGDDSYFWQGHGWDVFNFHGVLNITYRL